jgi:ATP-dependent RNA helicase RhlB
VTAPAGQPHAELAKPAPWSAAAFHVEPAEGKTRFHDLGLPAEVMHAIDDLKFKYCTPIQAEILPPALRGKDAYGRAQTGTGKTAAFLIAIFTRFLIKPLDGQRRRGTPRALVLAPTRELCIQIQKDALALGKYLPFKTVAVYGGMDYDKQRRELADVVDLVVATPGRLLDFKQQHAIHLSHVEVLVIDEADRMLDMGFIPDVRNIVHSTPHKGQRQTLFFTATLTQDVIRLANQWTTDPITVEIAPEQVAVDTVNQVIYIVTIKEKFALLYNVLTRDNADRVIVFANRRDEAERLCDYLRRYDINSALLSGAVPQHKRLRVLEDFKAGKIRVLVATDVAGRGLHVESVSHVINYNLPIDPEDYVHRIGRTGRAGALGTSVSFADEDDAQQIPAIEKYIGRTLPCTHPQEEWLKVPPPIHPEIRRERPSGPPRGRSGSGRGPRRGGGGRRGPPRRH